MKTANPLRALRSQHGRWRLGFTLIELLAVLAIISVVAIFFFRNRGADGDSASLRSAQAAIANLIDVARIKASASGQTTRIVLNVDAASTVGPKRYLHYLVAQLRTAAGWETITDCRLPTGMFVVPGNFSTIPAGLFFPNSTSWVRNDGVSALWSSALRATMLSTEAINASVSEEWVTISFSGVGTTAQSGDIVLAIGVPRTPGSWTAGESPIELRNPEAVRGLTLSSYGVTAFIDNRRSF
jgi:prepilin-type N-terminal cleavage/methylation domain-containing protein